MNMKKRDVIISLILSIVFGLLVLCTFTEVLCANEPICTEPVIEETTLCTTEPTDAIEETTEPNDFKIEDILFDKNLCYYKFDDKTILTESIKKCNDYITFLEQESVNYTEEDIEKIKNEINRVSEIIEQYMYDLNFTDKTVFNIPESYNQRDFKSYESYKVITSKNSPHYKLQNQYAVTGPEGIRKVDDRFCIAVGSYFTTTIGQYIDIVLANGTIIPCILGDQKSDAHTDEQHIAHSTDGSIVEFIVDLDVLNELPRKMGNISYVYSEWQSPVVQVIVYDTNFFDIADELAQANFWETRAQEFPVATEVWLYMKNEFGWNDIVCAGIMGNLMAECGGCWTHDLNWQDDGNQSFGLAQWTKGRRAAIFAKYGSLPTVKEQLEFMRDEMYGTNGVTKQLFKEEYLDTIMNAATPEGCAYAFAQYFERCNERHWAPRKGYARTAYEYFVYQ